MVLETDATNPLCGMKRSIPAESRIDGRSMFEISQGTPDVSRKSPKFGFRVIINTNGFSANISGIEIPTCIDEQFRDST